MAHISLILLLLLLFTTAISAATPPPPSGVNLVEVESMMARLRPLGYNLFCNAISTSDLQLTLLSSDDTFTLFAARDPFVYALDMASEAAAYVTTLRYHVTPNRHLTHSNLRNLKSPFLETLLPHYSILVTKDRAGRFNGSVRVDGVRISDPDIFVGSRIVVHGLDGILVTGIVKNDDLDDGERRLGLVSAPPPPPEEEGDSVVTPASDGAAAPVNASGNVPVTPPVNVPVMPPPVPVRPPVKTPGGRVPVRPPVKSPGHVLGRPPVKTPGHVPVKSPGHVPVRPPVKTPGHVPVRAPVSASGGKKGAKEKEKEARRGKNHHVIHQKATHSNRRRQNRRNRVHRKDDL